MSAAKTMMDNVIDWYMDACEGNHCVCAEEYRKAEGLINSAVEKADEQTRLEVHTAMADMVSSTEKQAFRDGFKAGARHTMELLIVLTEN